jgi:NAD(P)-dependent dehydrogenase (short-subunit alcohol dehydrogenase family)
MTLKGQHVVVTGAGRGIGAGIAQALAARGASISCSDIDRQSAADTARSIREQGGKAFSHQCDVTDLAGVERGLAEAREAGGDVTALVSNAGGAAGERTPFLDLTQERWHRMLDRNLTGAFHCGLVYGRHLAQSGGGAIVFITSTSADVVHRGVVHYCAAKGGMQQLMRGMAVELADHGVRVNAVAPGLTLTPGNDDILGRPGVIESSVARIPIGRVGRPEDYGGAVAYLLSDQAGFTTGATIVVDGGFTLL